MKGAGSTVQLYIDLQPDATAPHTGDWVATRAGARYRVESVRLAATKRHDQRKRWHLACVVLERDLDPPADVLVHWLTWYSRNRKAGT